MFSSCFWLVINGHSTASLTHFFVKRMNDCKWSLLPLASFHFFCKCGKQLSLSLATFSLRLIDQVPLSFNRLFFLPFLLLSVIAINCSLLWPSSFLPSFSFLLVCWVIGNFPFLFLGKSDSNCNEVSNLCQECIATAQTHCSFSYQFIPQ